MVTAIAVGQSSACALLSGGTVDCWGSNQFGTLGNGSSSGPETCGGQPCSTSPVAVSGLTGATAIVVGSASACALLSGGTVECWGSNQYGALGNGSSTGPDTCAGQPCSTSPVAVSGLTGATAIALGNESACALLSGGTVECWGANDSGQLGNGSTTASVTPMAVSGLSGVSAVAVGESSACALLSGGSVKCWGSNMFGGLGTGSSTGPDTCAGQSCTTSPVTVAGLTGATAIAVGAGSACALLAGGRVQCWGFNTAGELGDGTTTNSASPLPVSSLMGATAIAAGSSDQITCALLPGGTVDCWGNNIYGELGDGTSTGPGMCGGAACSTTPMAVSGLSGVTAISAGSRCCALLLGGAVECWGLNQGGALGNGSSTGPDTCKNGDSYPCSTTPVAVTW